MEDKKQYEAFMEELKKLANNFRDVVTELGDILAKILPDIEISDEEEEDTWEMKIPYEHNEAYYLLSHRGNVDKCWFNTNAVDKPRLFQGNVFKTKEAAELEAKRRNLLTRFRAFRNECNGEWKMCWSNYLENKYYIGSELEGIGVCSTVLIRVFPIFGYFKTREDAERAIELFGDEIIELYVNNEV